MIGLTTSIAAISGGEVPGGYALPMSAGLRRVIEVLKRGEEVEYGFLGVSLERMENVEGNGIRIGGVIRGLPAHKAGLQPGDRILEIDGKTLHDYDDLFLAIESHLAGSTVRLKLASSAKEPTVTLAKHNVPNKSIATHKPDSVGGLRVDYTSMLVQSGQGLRDFEVIPDGVMIREVQPGSAAEAAKLQVDKVISRVNGRTVSTPADFYREIRTNNETAELTIVNTDGQTYVVKLKLAPP